MNVFGVAECRYRLSAIKQYYTWIWYDADSRRHVSENSKRTVVLVPNHISVRMSILEC